MWCLLINNVPYCLRLLTETYFLMIIEHNTWRDLVQSLAERLKHIPVLNVCVDHRYMLLFHSFYQFFCPAFIKLQLELQSLLFYHVCCLAVQVKCLLTR